MSTVVPLIRGKPVPRWSNARAVPAASTAIALEPWFTTGLAAVIARVFVGPPLSCNSPRSGSEPTIFPLTPFITPPEVAASPIKLKALSPAAVPEMSVGSAVGPANKSLKIVLPLTMVLNSLVTPPLILIPPPPVLLTIVLLVITASPLLAIPPPEI